MSNWSYIKGVIDVSPYGRTQAECRYILETVLSHLPRVIGSEEDMYTHIVQCAGYNTSCSHNEFGEWTKDSSNQYQSNYMVIVEGYFRDKLFDETYRSFVKWLTRLSKRVWVDSCFVHVWGDTEKELKSSTIISNSLSDMFEPFSWCKEGTVNWSEYLIWKQPRDRHGNRLDIKPDFPDGSCLSLMSEKERQKYLFNKHYKK